jgi:hypothetical protein
LCSLGAGAFAGMEGKILQNLRIFWYSFALSIQIFYACTDKVKSISLLPGHKFLLPKLFFYVRSGAIRLKRIYSRR